MGSLVSLHFEREILLNSPATASARNHGSSSRRNITITNNTTTTTTTTTTINNSRNRRHCHHIFSEGTDQSTEIKISMQRTCDEATEKAFLLMAAAKYFDLDGDNRKKVAFSDIILTSPKLSVLEIPAHVTVYAEGDSGTCLYLIESGQVEMTRNSGILLNRHETITLESGSIFGESSFLFVSPRNATVMTTSRCRLWRFDRELYVEFKKKSCHFLLPNSALRFWELPEIASLDQEVMESLLSTTNCERYASGDKLFQMGKAAAKLMVIEEGIVDVLIPPALYNLTRSEQLAALGIAIDPDSSPLSSNTALRMLLQLALHEDNEQVVKDEEDEDESVDAKTWVSAPSSEVDQQSSLPNVATVEAEAKAVGDHSETKLSVRADVDDATGEGCVMESKPVLRPDSSMPPTPSMLPSILKTESREKETTCLPAMSLRPSESTRPLVPFRFPNASDTWVSPLPAEKSPPTPGGRLLRSLSVNSPSLTRVPVTTAATQAAAKGSQRAMSETRSLSNDHLSLTTGNVRRASILKSHSDHRLPPRLPPLAKSASCTILSTVTVTDRDLPTLRKDKVVLASETEFDRLLSKFKRLQSIVSTPTPSVFVPMLPTVFSAPPTPVESRRQSLAGYPNSAEEAQELLKDDRSLQQPSPSAQSVPASFSRDGSQMRMSPQLSTNPYELCVVETRRQGERHFKIGEGCIIGTGILGSMMGVPGCAEWVDRVDNGVPILGAVSPVTATAYSETVAVRSLLATRFGKALSRNGVFYNSLSMSLFRNQQAQDYFAQFTAKIAPCPASQARGPRRCSALEIEFVADEAVMVFEDNAFTVETVAGDGEAGLLVDAIYNPVDKDKDPPESSANEPSFAAALAAFTSPEPNAQTNSIRKSGLSRRLALGTFLTDTTEKLKKSFFFAGPQPVPSVAIQLQKYSLKVVSKAQAATDSLVPLLLNEATLLRSQALRHPFIVRRYGTYSTEKAVVFVMERCPATDLWSLIHSRDSAKEDEAKPAIDLGMPSRDDIPLDQPCSHLRFPQVRFYLASIVLALRHMHEHGVAFRNLAPENVLVDDGGFVKLFSCALAKKYPFADQGCICSRSYTVCGVVEYMAPEMILLSGHSLPVDAWALGVLLYEMLLGVTPFKMAAYAVHGSKTVGQRSPSPRRASQSESAIQATIAHTVSVGVSFDPDVTSKLAHLDGALELLSGLLEPQAAARWAVSDAPTSPIAKIPIFAGFEWNMLRTQMLVPPYVPSAGPVHAVQRAKNATRKKSWMETIFPSSSSSAARLSDIAAAQANPATRTASRYYSLNADSHSGGGRPSGLIVESEEYSDKGGLFAGF